MKIIIITDHLEANGGVNSFVFDLTKAFYSAGLDIYLIGLMKSTEKLEEIEIIEKMGVKVFRFDAISKLDAIMHYIPKLRELIKQLAKNEKTVLNLHLKLSVLLGAVASIGLRNIKCVETYHNTYHHYHMQCWTLSPIIKRYITVSDTAREEMHARFFTPYRKIRSIPNGVNRDELRRALNKREDDETFRILTVGRLSQEKNVILAIKALSSLQLDNYVYHVIGDGPLMDEATTCAGDHTVLLGALSRDKVLEYMSKADILIMPSLWEGRSIVQLEASAFDLPMIISDVPGLREPFKEKQLEKSEAYRVCKFGYIVRTNDEQAYRDAVFFHISHRELWEDMKTAVRGMSLENDITSVAQKYVEVMEEI